MHTRTIFITGANGYVGKQLVQHLAKQNLNVIASDIREAPPEQRAPNVTYQVGDIRDPNLATTLTAHAVDTVVHLASIVTPGKNSSREFEYSVDVDGTKNVLEACVKALVKQIVISSSGAAYGYHQDHPSLIDEAQPMRGNYEIPYSWHKRLVEEILAEYRVKHPDLKQTIFRIGTVLGETVNNQITALFQKPRILGITGSKSPYVFIWDQDLIRIFLYAIENTIDGVYNVAGTGYLSIDDIANKLQKSVLRIPAPVMRTALRVLKVFNLTQYHPEQTKFIQYRPVLNNKKLLQNFPGLPTKTSEQVFDFWMKARGLPMILFLFFTTISAQAHTVKVLDESGKPIPTVMVTQTLTHPTAHDTSDNGYAKPQTLQPTDAEHSAFTNASGVATLPDVTAPTKIRLRKFGYQDLWIENKVSSHTIMKRETDPHKLAESKPANIWLGAMNLGEALKLHPQAKQHFQMQCGFCHQFGHSFTRLDRTEGEWDTLIKRMVDYGSRLPTDLQKALPKVLPQALKDLRDHPEKISDPAPWSADLKNAHITEWPIGDGMSQTHDLLWLGKGIVIVADNIQDRLYEVDTIHNNYKIHKVPHREGEENGGLLAARLKAFPKHDSTSNAHSLARSEKDGHIFITPSAQRRLVEFNPDNGEFMLYEMPDGFYPHTIRVDQKDRVWFTLALSNQVARFDRDTKKFTIYDLPSRGLKEKLVTGGVKFLYTLMNLGIPISKIINVDWDSTGVPLAYGIDITPDGKIWCTQLHAQQIVSIDPDTGKLESFHTPQLGPRRLRSDDAGNLWITLYGASGISKFDPKTRQFTDYPLPVQPAGSDTPYALNVDRKRNLVWINGNQSDSLYRFNPTTNQWLTIPLPRRTSFTRDIEFDDAGNAYTAISNFPSWQIETGQPTLIRVQTK